jgi:hypothetical protein
LDVIVMLEDALNVAPKAGDVMLLSGTCGSQSL